MKRKIAKLLFIAFVLISLIEAYSVYKHNVPLEAIVKPFIIILLSGFYLLSAKKINKWYLIALLFSFLGDFLLLDLRLFLLGTSCFLIVHLIYVKITLDYIGKVSTGKALLPMFFFLAFLILIIWLIKDKIDSFIVLIICYGAILCSFAALSFFNYLEKNTKPNLTLFLAAFVFIITNSLIAINRFYGVGDLNRGLSMIGYSFAQCLVCFAVIKNPVSRNTFNKKTILLSVFFLSAILGLFVFTSGKHDMTFIVVPLVFATLLVMYIGSVKKINPLFVTYSILTIFAETLLLFKEKFILLAIVNSILAQLILIDIIIKQKTIRIKQVLIYFIVIILCYFILYSLVVTTKGHCLYVIFGFVNAILTSLALDNYTKKMQMPNYLLWLGVSFGVLDTIIVSLDVYNSHLNVYSYVINVISHYLICRSFIILDKRSYSKRVN